MNFFAEWERRMAFPTVQAAADALGISRRHVYRLRHGETPSLTLLLLMIAHIRLRALGESPQDLLDKVCDLSRHLR